MIERYRTSEARLRTECGRWYFIRPPAASGWYLQPSEYLDADPLFDTGIFSNHRWPTRTALLDDLSAACASVGVAPPSRVQRRTGGCGWWTVDGAIYHYRPTFTMPRRWASTLVRDPDPRHHEWSPHQCDHRVVGNNFPTRSAATRAARRIQAESDSSGWWSRQTASPSGIYGEVVT